MVVVGVPRRDQSAGDVRGRIAKASSDRGLVDRNARPVERFLRLVERLRVHGSRIGPRAIDELLQFGAAGLDRLDLVPRKLVPDSIEGLADPLQVEGRVHREIDHPVDMHVLAGMLEGFRLDAVDLLRGESVCGKDLDRGTPPAPTLDRLDPEHAVGIDLEGDLDLGNARRHRG